MIPKDTKICISTQHPGQGGGIGRIVDNFTDYLLRNKYKPTLAFASNIIPNLFFNESTENKIMNQKLVNGAITTKTYIPFYYPNYLIYGKIMKSRLEKFDVCHQIGGSSLEATPFLQAKRKYICWTATTFLDEWKGAFNPKEKSRPAAWVLGKVNHLSLEPIRRIEKKIYQNATIINPISTRTANMIKKEFKIPEEKIKIIPPPTDFKQLSIPKNNKKIPYEYLLFVGRLDKRKNLEILLKAFQKVNKKSKELKLVILGDGPERQSLERTAVLLGIRNQVIFTGFTDDETKANYISQAKILTISSKQEGFGIVLVEALALEVPVVSTDCGGPSDIVENGKSGYLTKIGDYEQMAEKIQMLVTDDNLRKDFGRYGKKSVLEKFSIEKIGKAVLEEYEEISGLTKP